MLISEKRKYEHAELVAEFFKDRVDVECQHLARYEAVTTLGVKTGIEFDLSAVDPKFFIYEIARQAFEQGMNAGIKHKINQIRHVLEIEPLKEYNDEI